MNPLPTGKELFSDREYYEWEQSMDAERQFLGDVYDFVMPQSRGDVALEIATGPIPVAGLGRAGWRGIAKGLRKMGVNPLARGANKLDDITRLSRIPVENEAKAAYDELVKLAPETGKKKAVKKMSGPFAPPGQKGKVPPPPKIGEVVPHQSREVTSSIIDTRPGQYPQGKLNVGTDFRGWPEGKGPGKDWSAEASIREALKRANDPNWVPPDSRPLVVKLREEAMELWDRGTAYDAVYEQRKLAANLPKETLTPVQAKRIKYEDTGPRSRGWAEKRTGPDQRAPGPRPDIKPTSVQPTQQYGAPTHSPKLISEEGLSQTYRGQVGEPAIGGSPGTGNAPYETLGDRQIADIANPATSSAGELPDDISMFEANRLADEHIAEAGRLFEEADEIEKAGGFKEWVLEKDAIKAGEEIKVHSSHLTGGGERRWETRIKNPWWAGGHKKVLEGRIARMKAGDPHQLARSNKNLQPDGTYLINKGDPIYPITPYKGGHTGRSVIPEKVSWIDDMGQGDEVNLRLSEGGAKSVNETGEELMRMGPEGPVPVPVPYRNTLSAPEGFEAVKIAPSREVALQVAREQLLKQEEKLFELSKAKQLTPSYLQSEFDDAIMEGQQRLTELREWEQANVGGIADITEEGLDPDSYGALDEVLEEKFGSAMKKDTNYE